MINEKRKAPIGGNRIGAEEQMCQKHLMPILTHYPHRRKRVRFVWTPLNVAMLILLAAAAIYLIVVKLLVVDPLASDYISMANTVFTV